MSQAAIKDRIIDFRRVKASDLHAHPKNWRKHPTAQREALRTVLKEIGFADALLVREDEDGLQIIDGHLRAEIRGDAEVPVLVTDLSAEEATKLLLTLDPLAAMADADTHLLEELLDSINSDDERMNELLDSIGEDHGIFKDQSSEEHEDPLSGIPESFMIVVGCESEEHQAELLERFAEEGLICRALIS